MVMEFGDVEVNGDLDLEALLEGGCELFSSSGSSRVLLRRSIAFCLGFQVTGADNKISQRSLVKQRVKFKRGL